MAATRLGSALCANKTTIDHVSTSVRHSDAALILKANAYYSRYQVQYQYTYGIWLPSHYKGRSRTRRVYPSLSPLCPLLLKRVDGIRTASAHIYDDTVPSSEHNIYYTCNNARRFSNSASFAFLGFSYFESPGAYVKFLFCSSG